MLSGQAPDGRSLMGKVVDPKKRRAATDFTFSAPKSASIAALVQQDEAGRPVGITVEHYSQTVTTPAIEVSLPGEPMQAAATP